MHRACTYERSRLLELLHFYQIELYFHTTTTTPTQRRSRPPHLLLSLCVAAFEAIRCLLKGARQVRSEQRSLCRRRFRHECLTEKARESEREREREREEREEGGRGEGIIGRRFYGRGTNDGEDRMHVCTNATYMHDAPPQSRSRRASQVCTQEADSRGIASRHR